ncbi:MAG: metallophosphoesterase family protein [Bradymonadaceae bacterium]|nr:metallophosphoesterase family protein [Lujinxingiaceae bacterium]
MKICSRPPCLLAALFVALCTVLVASSAAAQQLTRGPYLQVGTPSSMTVVWRTDVSSAGVVRYGTAADALNSTANATAVGTQHEVRITGLAPSTRYFYSVGTATTRLAGADADHYFVTAPTTGSRTRFRAWVVGDSGNGSSAQRRVRDAMLAEVGQDLPDIYLHMGDMAYTDGTDQQFQLYFFDIYQQVLRNTVSWATLGNHEGHSSSSSTQSGPYYDAYVLPKSAEAGGMSSGTEAYYSFDYANVHFVVLDSYDSPRGVGGAMLNWLQADLGATDQEWIIAFWHHPPYTKGSHNSDTESALRQMRENALPILEAAGVDMVLAGHSHIYERSFLVHGAYATPTVAAGHIVDDGDGKPEGAGAYQKQSGAQDGAVYVVAGHGGAGLSGTADHPLMYFSEKIHGSCMLEINGSTLTLKNIRHDGVISDNFTLIKGDGVVLTYVRGGEELLVGSEVELRWISSGATNAVRLDYSSDDGTSWRPIAELSDVNRYRWLVPSRPVAKARIRVVDIDTPTNFDVSGAFAITTNTSRTVIPFGDVWKYSDRDVDHAAAWRDLAYDDAAWPEGPAQLGYGDGDEATVIHSQNPNIASVYFRKGFWLEGEVNQAELDMLFDDAIAVWINGTEITAHNMGNGYAHASFASSASADNERARHVLDLSVNNPFVAGPNVVTALVKQANASSSDLSFDLQLRLRIEVELPPLGDDVGNPPDAGTANTDATTPTDDTGPPPTIGDAATLADLGQSHDTERPDDLQTIPSAIDVQGTDGCQCRVASGQIAPTGLLAVLFAALLIWRRRRT